MHDGGVVGEGVVGCGVGTGFYLKMQKTCVGAFVVGDGVVGTGVGARVQYL